MTYATIQAIDYLLNNGGIGSSREKQLMVYTCQDIAKRIDQNFKRLGISPYGTRKYSGNLKRSVHWAVFNASRGNESIIRFYVQNVSSFVELSVQRGFKVTDGGLPPQIPKGGGGNFSPITVNRQNQSGHILRRKAKPFIGHELRLHGRSLFNRLIRDYGYIGSLYILKGALPENAGRSDVLQMKTNGWESNINTFRFDA